MQVFKPVVVTVLILFVAKAFPQQNQPSPFFCNALQMVVNDANNHFVEQTNRDRLALLNTRDENRWEASLGLPGFFYAKIITQGVEGLYYEALVPNIRDTAAIIQSLKDIDFHITGCLPGIKRGPRGSDSLEYSYYYQRGDTTEEIFIRMQGIYPSDEEGFFSPGYVSLRIYGDDRRSFIPFKSNTKKKDTALSNRLRKIEAGLLNDINTIRGKETIDLFNNKIWKTKVQIPGATYSYIKPLPEVYEMPYVYYGEFFMGESLDEAKKVFKKWEEKLKNNAFTEKRFTHKNREKLQWIFLPYNQHFDPEDYANIVEQTGFSCPDRSAEPFNRTPLFTYHLFIMKFIDSYIVAVNIGTRY